MKINGDLFFITETKLITPLVNLGSKEVLNPEHANQSFLNQIREMYESRKQDYESFKINEYDITFSYIEDYRVAFYLVTLNERQENIKKALDRIVEEFHWRYEIKEIPLFDYGLEYFDMFVKDISTFFHSEL